MDYIGYRQIETLLKNLPILRTVLANLQIEYKTIYDAGKEWLGSEYDVFYTKMIGNHVLTDMPFCGDNNSGDKVINLAVEGPYRDYEGALKEIMFGINTISLVIERIDEAINKQLNQEERDLIQDKFILRLSAKKMQKKYHLSREQIWRNRHKATELIASLTRISEEQYDFCMGQLEGKEG